MKHLTICLILISALKGLAQPYDTDAEWLEEANWRIDAVRKGDLNIEVLSSSGKPMEGVTVHIKMQRHAFAFEITEAPNFSGGADSESVAHFKFLNPTAGVFNSATASQDPEIDFRAENRMDQMVWLADNGYNLSAEHLIYRDFSGTATLSGTELFDVLRQSVTSQINFFAPVVDTTHINLLNEPREGGHFGGDIINPRVPHEEVASIATMARNLLDSYGDEDTVLLINEAKVFSNSGIPANISLEQGSFFDYLSNAHQFELYLQQLNAYDAPIGGFGIQQHHNLAYKIPIKDMYKMYDGISRLAEFYPKAYITEFDIKASSDFPTPEELNEMAIVADALMRTWFAHPAIHGIAWWGGLRDKTHWLNFSPFYSNDWTLKPTGEVWMNLVNGEWKTNATVTTGPDGKAFARVFFGEYRITVEKDGEFYATELSFPEGDEMNIRIRPVFASTRSNLFVPNGDGTYSLGALGTIHIDSYPKGYFEGLGEELYMFPQKDGGFWLYSPVKGWFWTKDGWYPHLYFVEHGWCYYLESPEYPYWHYIYQNRGFDRLPKDNLFGENMVANGLFDFDLIGWTLSTDEATAYYQFVSEGSSTSEKQLLVEIEDGGSTPDSVVLQQTVKLGDGQLYGLSFDARSDVGRMLTVMVGINDTAGTVLKQDSFDLTPEWKHFHTRFENDTVDFKAVLRFLLGGGSGDIYLDNIRFIRDDANTNSIWDDGAKDNLLGFELLSNGNFTDGMTGWSFIYNGTASATGEVLETPDIEGNALLVTQTHKGNPDLVRLRAQGKYYLQAETTYKFSFMHRAVNAERDWEVQFLGPAYPYQRFRDKQGVSTTEWQRYSAEFRVPSDDYHTVTIALGESTEQIMLGEISLKGPLNDKGPTPSGTLFEDTDWYLLNIGREDETVGATCEPNGEIYTLTEKTGQAITTPVEAAFLYRKEDGPTVMELQVDSIDSLGTDATAGIMARASLHNSSTQAFLCIFKNGDVDMKYIRAVGVNGRPLENTVKGVGLPVWLRMEREGNLVSGYYRKSKSDEWTLIRRVVLQLDDGVYMGMASSSDQQEAAGDSGMATFSSVSISHP